MTTQTSTRPDAPAADTTTTFREATRRALREALHADDRVFLLGEDVGAYGGCFAVTAGMLEEFGPERIRDTPLSESVFTGAGIGAAMGGMRPIVEIMTCNFSLLALDQIVNNAATYLHMSGGQFNVPVVIRTTAGAGRQLAAQHSHSFEPIYAHVPGIRVVAAGTIEDAHGMVHAALADPDPVVIFEYPALYGLEGELPADPAPVDLKALDAAAELADDGIEVEVVDLRSLRPLDEATIMASLARTHRLLIAEEAWRSGGIGAEVAARAADRGFWELDAPVARVAGVEVPTPYAAHLEEASIPQVGDLVAAARELVNAGG